MQGIAKGYSQSSRHFTYFAHLVWAVWLDPAHLGHILGAKLESLGYRCSSRRRLGRRPVLNVH